MKRSSKAPSVPPTGDATEICGASAGSQMFHRLEDAQRDLGAGLESLKPLFNGITVGFREVLGG